MLFPFEITFYSPDVQAKVMALPATLAARFFTLADRMRVVGPNLGEPHTKAMRGGLFEMRLKGAEGIARVMYCTRVGKRIVVLHSFIKKTDKTPRQDLAMALKRLKEIKDADL